MDLKLTGTYLYFVTALIVIVTILSFVVFFVYYVKKEDLTVRDVETDVILRTGGSAGGTGVNMYEFGQPGQGDQFRTPSYDKLWMHNIPGQYGGVEGFQNTRCSGYAGDNAYLDKHLNIKTPDGASIYSAMTDDEFYGTDTPLDVDKGKAMIATRNKRIYEDCLARGGSQYACSLPFSSYVDANLQSDAWRK